MNIEKRYFKYHLKKQLPSLLIILAISLWLVWTGSINEYAFYDEKLDDFTPGLSLGPASTILGLMSVFMPIAEFSMFKKRKDLDNLFSLPISRERMFGVHFLTGLMANSIVFLLCAVVAFFCGISIHLPLSSLVYMIPYCFCALLWGAVLYAFFTFIFYEGNTVTDGALFVWAHTVVPLMFLGGIAVLLEICGVNTSIGFVRAVAGMSPISPLIWINSYFGDLICPIEDFFHYFGVTPDLLNMGIVAAIYLIAGVLAGIAFFRCSVNKRVEQTGEISESWFGYRTLIPLGLFPIFTSVGLALPLVAVAVACAIAVYLIYRRGLHLRKQDWIVIGCLSAYGMILVPILDVLCNN